MSPIYIDEEIETILAVSDGVEQENGRRTVLIVDDQRSVRVSLEYLLGLANYRVLSADSGLAAVAVAEREHIDGAIIDIHMPVMNGFEACGRLQAQASAMGRELRVWFMTGAFTSNLEPKCAELGGLGVLTKPFDFPGFLARLERGFSAPLPVARSATANTGAGDTIAIAPQ
jgi:CheY-like chemotaxis protein